MKQYLPFIIAALIGLWLLGPIGAVLAVIIVVLVRLMPSSPTPKE